jgi:predicted SPOUT superfamily RNA methylase MTH1
MAQNKVDEIIVIRRCTSPNDKVKLIYDKLGYKYTPFFKKKSVVHKIIFEKKYPSDFVDFNSS